MSEEVRSRNSYVYYFDEGRAEMKDLLGGKGANLAEMTRLGLSVPPGFTITTEACLDYIETGSFSASLIEEIEENLKRLERERGQRLGSKENPLLVSVRSGAAISMPGMMDTILNLGLNREAASGLAEVTGDRRFALDCYRRFIQMFANVVQGVDNARFEEVLQRARDEAGVKSDAGLSAGQMDGIIDEYLYIYREQTGGEFPSDPWEQLLAAIEAVFASWNNERAVVYRRVNDIPNDLGTAVNVQTMVFGNRGDRGGTGVLFTRDPATGERKLYGEYLSNAQGEDVVAGIRTPRMVRELEEDLPGVFSDLKSAAEILEEHYRDMQDIEFTVEDGQLFLLQTRTGKRTSQAAVKIAHDMVAEGLIDKEEALSRVDPESIDALLHPRIDPQEQVNTVATGLPASPGAASGRVVFTADEAEVWGGEGEDVILVRPETTPDDIHGIVQARGVLTSRGGMTCHAAIVARGMGKPCVVGCDALDIDLENRAARSGDFVIGEGDVITIDGATGEVFASEVSLIEPELADEFETLLEWADEVREIGVRANADTPEDSRRARDFGAEGIGLCRTEHMFMEPGRLSAVQQMILAETSEERRAALEKILPMQRGDFEEIFREMDGLPVTVRLLDPPLHEFLPDEDELSEEIEDLIGGDAPSEKIREKEELLRKAHALQEVNPMLGQRGCRLGILYPEIYEMQARAIFQAAASVKEAGVEVHPEVMIPLISGVEEYQRIAGMIHRVAWDIQNDTDTSFDYTVGTMIEVPRACLVADELGNVAEFFSFGTNDLTQTTYGFSRDDAEAKFLHQYLKWDILEDNPFAVLDTDGVGKLIELGIELGRSARSNLEVGICGEHGADPRSIEFCARVGMDYVSCSPYRVPVARLAAARAALRLR